MDSFTEVSNQSWFSRIGDSIKGVLFGAVLFVAGFPILFLNEGCAVSNAKSLGELRDNLVSVSADKVDEANNGRPVHLSGQAVTDATLTDAQFGYSQEQAIVLSRQVEMYQWQEEQDTKKERQTGGSEKTTTTYQYDRVWSDQPIASQNFKHPEGHQNPPMPYRGETWYAKDVRLGAFELSPALVHQINLPNENAPLNQEILTTIPQDLQGRASLDGDEIYVGGNSASPQLGDLRIAYKVVHPTEVSIIAQQEGAGFTPYQASAGRQYEILTNGEHSAEQMTASIASADAMMKWGLRLGGFLAMFIGLSMIFAPLATLADVLPFLGDMMRMGTGLVAGVIAASLSLLTIAVAWIFYRPLLGVALLVVAIGLIVALKMWGRKKKQLEVPEGDFEVVSA